MTFKKSLSTALINILYSQRHYDSAEKNTENLRYGNLTNYQPPGCGVYFLAN